MARRDLHVPFDEKDEAKRLGARWDANARRWYVPDGISADAFAKWFEPLVPNAATIEAMKEARRGGLKSFATIEDLMANLNARP